MPSTNLVDRFWAAVDRRGPEECWPWLKGKDGHGYGAFTFHGRTMGAHRFAYERLFGPIHPDLELDHVAARGCTRRDCCNPWHLEEVTHAENVRRRAVTQRRDQKASQAPTQAHLITIVEAVADECRVTPEVLISPSRAPMLVAARHRAMKIARDAGYSLPQIGRALNRDHTTVLYGLRKTQRQDREPERFAGRRLADGPERHAGFQGLSL